MLKSDLQDPTNKALMFREMESPTKKTVRRKEEDATEAEAVKGVGWGG